METLVRRGLVILLLFFFGLFTFACFCFDVFLFFLFAFFFKSGELRLLEYPIITPCFYWRGKFHSPWIQSSVGKKMATGTFTHSSYRKKTLATFIKTHRKVIKSSNLGCTTFFVQGKIL